jgi:hypothetical protein
MIRRRDTGNNDRTDRRGAEQGTVVELHLFTAVAAARTKTESPKTAWSGLRVWVTLFVSRLGNTPLGKKGRGVSQEWVTLRGDLWDAATSQGRSATTSAKRLQVKFQSGINGLLPTCGGPLHLFRLELDLEPLRAQRGYCILRLICVRSFLAPCDQGQNVLV